MFLDLDRQVPVTTTLVCDFCNSPYVRWQFPCRSFQMTSPLAGVIHSVLNNWMACDTCHELIEEDDWQAMGRRHTMRMHWAGVPGWMRPGLVKERDTLWAMFREHRCGEGVPV